MGSKDRETRNLQRERYQELLACRKALLTELHVPPDKQLKDKVVIRLQAKINQITKAIVAIKKVGATLERAAIAKQTNREKKKTDTAKDKKQKSEQPPVKEGGKEKKKKKTEGK